MQQRLPSVVFLALCLIWGSTWLEKLEPIAVLGTLLILSGVYVTVEQDKEIIP
jgi:hypothetical protein